ncbi:hypothetical protein LTR91_014833 [Friedmanniomyces endolithicus]|uniref:Uncharacterized protein n=1 Tax=Friedmanniomyces endolithicus TaxID=329885 RepID=A0AAN6KAY0_9PEZI|nr:hypothetical protein LTS01_016253 [Friedmanniomyces endolithicus]KAK0973116.1 hypothetical protein LTR91_014833 [Friedmanniomyces endolithicus]KAK1044442.1 hypothetical protein LTS16_007277 [Friedmanniomyces endolithicus]
MEELSILYETKVWQTAEQKRPPFTSALYANGFSPVIEDPNTNVKIFECLMDFPCQESEQSIANGSSCNAHSKGASLSNTFYFARNPNQDARKHHVEEALRVLGVIEQHKEYFTGSKVTVAYLFHVLYMSSLAVSPTLLEMGGPRH